MVGGALDSWGRDAVKVVEIKHLTPAIRFDPKCDCIDVVAYFENGNRQAYEACTASYLPQYMEEHGLSYISFNLSLIIVDELSLGSVKKLLNHFEFKIDNI